MTRNTEFTDWPAKYGPPPAPPYVRCSPNLIVIEKELIRRFGGGPLGCWGIRDNRAGTAISTHSYAANDWSYRGGGRAGGLAAISFLVENSLELGIGAVHDYIGCRIWRGNRDPKVFPDGWKIQPKDKDGMGQPWADWLHMEVTDTSWFDDSPIADRLAGVHPPAQVRPVIGLNSNGPLVVALQQFLSTPSPGPNQAAIVGKVDGFFGPRTRLAWLNFAIWINTAYPGAMTTDGNVDGVDWNVVAWYSGGWEKLLAAGFPPGI